MKRSALLVMIKTTDIRTLRLALNIAITSEAELGQCTDSEGQRDADRNIKRFEKVRAKLETWMETGGL